MATSLPYAEMCVNKNLCPLHMLMGQNAEMEKHDRLREARIKAGYTSAAEAARRLNVPYGTYSGHENGSRGIKDKELFRYAKVFKVSPIWLIFGTETSGAEPKFAELMGVAGHLPNGEIELLEEDEAEGEILLSSLFSDGVSYIKITGDHMRGIAEDGWMIFADSQMILPSAVAPGTLCVCILEDGRCMCRFVFPSKEHGKFDLEAPLLKTERSVELRAVSEVLSIATTVLVDMLRQIGATMLLDYKSAG